MSKLSRLFTSRKFYAALIGLIVLVVKEIDPRFPLSAEQITGIVTILAAYILGVAVEDSGLTSYGRDS